MARRKAKMRTNKVKRVKRTRNSRRTKRNTRRRRNKRGGDYKGTLKLFTELGKGVSGAVGRSLKEKYHKYLKRKTKDQTDKGNRESLLEEQNTAEAKAKADKADKEERDRLKSEAMYHGIKLKEHLENIAGKNAEDKRKEKETRDKKNGDYAYGGHWRSDYSFNIRNKDHYTNYEETQKEREYNALRDLFPREKYPQLY